MPLSGSRAGVTVPAATPTAGARRAAGLATLAALVGAVGLGRYVAGSPGLLHLRVPEGPVAAVGGLAALALAAFVVVRPAAALLLLVGVVYLNLSDVLVRMGAPSVLQLLAVPILLAAVTSRGRAELARLARQPLAWLLAANVLLLLATTTYAARPELATDRVGEAARGFAIFSLVLLLAATNGRVRLASWGMLAAGAFLGTLGVYQYLTGDFDRSFGGLARSKQAQIYGDVFEPRIAGPLGDPNFFAQILLVLVPIGLFLAWGERRAGRRLVAFGLVAAVVAGTLLTFSRGGALALAVVIVLALLGHGVDWRRISAGAAALVLAAAFLLPSGFAERLTTIAQLLPGGAEEVVHLDTSFEERRLLTGTAWEIFVDHPLLGVGAGNFTVHYAAYAAERGSAAPDYNGPGTERLPHSLYLEVAAETGLVGLALLAAALAAAFAALWRARHAFRDAGADAMAGLAGAFAIALAGYLASSVFLHGAFQRYLWLLLGVAAALEAAAPARRRPGPEDGRRGGLPPPGSAPALDEGLTGRDEVAGVRVRRPVAVVLSRFPSVTETFVLREVIEMERQGQPVLLVPLMREYPPVVHAEARPWVERALYTPLLSLPVASANLRMLARQPLRYGGILARLLAGTWWSPRYFLATLGFFPKSVYLSERLRAEGVRHVHAHFATHPATAALVVAELTGATFSFTVHAHDLLSRKYRPLLALKVRRARFVRLISEYNRDFLRRLLPDTPPEKLHVVHVGIEPEAYSGAVEPQPEPGPARLLTIAGFKPYKGLPVLLAAARRLRDGEFDFRWDIVGDGPQRAEIERSVREQGLGPYVHLTGALPQDEVGRMLRRRPLYVQPSVILSDGWMEGIPVALMEAMAAGAPVVASRLSGIPELVVDGATGLLVEPGDPDALAAAVRRVAGDAQLARRLSQGGRARVETAFRLDRCVAELLDLLDLHDEPIEPPELEEAVARVGQEAGARRVGVSRVHAGPDAYVAELVVPGAEGHRAWVLKAHREVANADRTAAERARHEFAVLRELAPALGGSCLPEPVSIDETHAVVVMEACPGERLADLFRKGRTARGGEEGLIAAVAAAGRWLRAFQDATASPAHAVAAHAAWRAAAEADLARCRDLLPTGWASRLPAALDAFERSASAGALRSVGYHGDLWPGNLFVDGERVSAIDLEGYRRGLAYEDAAYFVVQLEGFFDYPGLRAPGRRLAAAFLGAYLVDEPLDDPGYRLMRATKALQVLARSGAGRRRRRVRLVRTVEGVLR